MQTDKIGNTIRNLRMERNMTQKQLADRLGVSDKAVSKWERGLGCPDISMIPDLAGFLGVDIGKLLAGDLAPNDFVGGNMKKSKYYVCPICRNITLCTGEAEVSCCGRKLEPQRMQKAEESERLSVEAIENDWFITSDHPMTKAHYISFVALAYGGGIQIIKQYPEWNLQLRIPKGGRGMLVWHCVEHGLFYQWV